MTAGMLHDHAESEVLVSLEHVVKEFTVRSSRLFARPKEVVHAVSDVTLTSGPR